MSANLEMFEGSYVTEEMRMFRKSFRQFIQKECTPNRAKWKAQGMVDRDLWNKAGAAGFLCPAIPTEYGGGGGNFAYDKIVTEELGIAMIDFGANIHSGIIAHYFTAHGSEEQKLKWLPKLASGEFVSAVAMTEPDTGSDLQSIRTTAIADGDDYVINGQKMFISNGQQADIIIVVAKTDPTEKAKGVSLIVVETKDLKGFTRGRNLDKIGMEMQDTSELFFADVRVPKANLLGPVEGMGFIQLMQELPRERLILAVGSMAIMQQSLDLTIDYVKQRKAFGKRIMDFQNTRFTLAEGQTLSTIAYIFMEKCTELMIAGKLDIPTAAMAKWWVTKEQFNITDDCLQLHGGYGYMNEYPIAEIWRSSRCQQIYGGTNEIMKELIGRML
jgi:acyl-CoA dehydrogenase